MKFFYNLERKYGKYAIHNLMYYLVVMYGIGLIISMWNPMIYYRYLALDGNAILHGQIWRMITFLCYPPVPGLFFGILALYMYYSMGQTLERVWGAFRFNLYVFLGILGHVLAEIVITLAFGFSPNLLPVALDFSLFFAFALTFPDVEFLLMYLIPIKAKWLAVAEGAVYLYYLIAGDLATKIEIGMTMANVIVFFLLTRNYNRINPKEIKRKHDFKSQVRMKPQGRTRHKCAVCGRTEQDGPGMEFRYCSKCAGNYEYCQDHLYTHKHVTSEGATGPTEIKP